MAERILSRRDFLKLLGYGAVAVTFAPIVNLGGLKELKKLFPSPASLRHQVLGHLVRIQRLLRYMPLYCQVEEYFILLDLDTTGIAPMDRLMLG